MKGGSHLILGIAGAALVHTHVQPLAATPLDYALVFGAAAIGSLLPDIDHPNSTITNGLGCVGALLSGVARFVGGHRGVTHMLLTWFVVSWLVLFAMAIYVRGNAGIAIAFSVAYLLHLLADAITVEGVPLFAPLYSKRVCLLPGAIAIRTGSFVEYLLLVVTGVWLVTLWRGGA